MSQAPLVSIVVLNWNGGALFQQCLDAVERLAYPNLEVVVVDNGSSDGSIQPARCRSGVTVIENGQNLGFGAGMNVGLRACRGEFVVPLNCDVVLDRCFVAESVQRLAAHAQVGMIAPRILRLAHQGPTDNLLQTGLLLTRQFRYRNCPDPGKEQAVFAPSGCCPVLRRCALADAQLEDGSFYDPSFFAYYEDVDLWFRLHLRGWDCLYVPSAVAWHAVSATIDGAERIYEKPFRVASNALRNRLWAIIANYPGRLLLKDAFFLIAFEAATWLFFSVRYPKTGAAMLRAWYLVGASMGRLIKKRRRVLSARRVTDRELLDRMRGKRTT